jgi:Uma2 family endonuclease
MNILATDRTVSTTNRTPHFFLAHPYVWHSATWDDYVALRDYSEQHGNLSKLRIFFDRNQLWIEPMGEGILHAGLNNLFTMIFLIWKQRYPDQKMTSLGGVGIEKPKDKASVPDLLLYVGDDYPTWKPGQARLLDLSVMRVPDLVGEVGDTTLSDDLDEKKRLYASLGIPEYWVIDVKGSRIFAFQLQSSGTYQSITHSTILSDLPIALLEETIALTATQSNMDAALWFGEQLNLFESH